MQQLEKRVFLGLNDVDDDSVPLEERMLAAVTELGKRIAASDEEIARLRAEVACVKEKNRVLEQAKRISDAALEEYAERAEFDWEMS